MAFDGHILDPNHGEQYEAFAGLLAIIGNREKRPRNRHVVLREDVNVRLEIPGAEPIEGRLVNFSTECGIPKNNEEQ